MIKHKFKISGMHCTSCAMSIDMDLEDLEGVKSSNTNYAKQETVVEYDEGKLNPKDIIQTIEKTGYSSSLSES